MVMAGMEDLVIGGGTEMMSLPKKGLLPMGASNAHLQEIHPQSHQGVCADAIASLEGIDRADARRARGRVAAPRRRGHQGGPLRPQPRSRCSTSTARVALDHEEFPRPGTTAESLAALPPSFPAVADYRHAEDAPTFRELINQKYPDLEIEHVHHAGNSSGVVDGAAAVLYASARLRQGARPEAPGPHRRQRQHGRRPDADAQRAGARRPARSSTGPA